MSVEIKNCSVCNVPSTSKCADCGKFVCGKHMQWAWMKNGKTYCSKCFEPFKAIKFK